MARAAITCCWRRPGEKLRFIDIHALPTSQSCGVRRRRTPQAVNTAAMSSATKKRAPSRSYPSSSRSSYSVRTCRIYAIRDNQAAASANAVLRASTVEGVIDDGCELELRNSRCHLAKCSFDFSPSGHRLLLCSSEYSQLSCSRPWLTGMYLSTRERPW